MRFPRSDLDELAAKRGNVKFPSVQTRKGGISIRPNMETWNFHLSKNRNMEFPYPPSSHHRLSGVSTNPQPQLTRLAPQLERDGIPSPMNAWHHILCLWFDARMFALARTNRSSRPIPPGYFSILLNELGVATHCRHFPALCWSWQSPALHPSRTDTLDHLAVDDVTGVDLSELLFCSYY